MGRIVSGGLAGYDAGWKRVQTLRTRNRTCSCVHQFEYGAKNRKNL